MKKKKSKSSSSAQRNPYVLPARKRKAGKMKNKKDKRAEENKNPDYTQEQY